MLTDFLFGGNDRYRLCREAILGIGAVAMRHGQVSRDLFPNYPVNSITNGLRAPTWTAGGRRVTWKG